MIQNHRSRISFKRTLYHDSRVNLRPVNRSLEHLLETQHAMPVIEKHCAKVFGFTVAEFELQILSHGSRGGERGPNVVNCTGRRSCSTPPGTKKAGEHLRASEGPSARLVRRTGLAGGREENEE